MSGKIIDFKETEKYDPLLLISLIPDMTEYIFRTNYPSAKGKFCNLKDWLDVLFTFVAKFEVKKQSKYISISIIAKG